jgi:hypothetical protein
MAVSHIAFNDQLPHGRQLRAALSKIEDGYESLNEVIAIMTRMIDGDGSSAAHFTYMVTKMGFADTAGAKAAFDELNSLAFKLNTNASVTDVNAALLQVFSKFG